MGNGKSKGQNDEAKVLPITSEADSKITENNKESNDDKNDVTTFINLKQISENQSGNEEITSSSSEGIKTNTIEIVDSKSTDNSTKNTNGSGDDQFFVKQHTTKLDSFHLSVDGNDALKISTRILPTSDKNIIFSVRHVEICEINLVGILPPWLEPIRDTILKKLYPDYNINKDRDKGEGEGNTEKNSITDEFVKEDESDDLGELEKEKLSNESNKSESNLTIESAKREQIDTQNTSTNYSNNGHDEEDGNYEEDVREKSHLDTGREELLGIDSSINNYDTNKEEENNEIENSTKETPSNKAEGEEDDDVISIHAVLPPAPVYPTHYADARFRQYCSLNRVFGNEAEISSVGNEGVDICTCVDVSINRIRNLDFPNLSFNYQNLLCLNISNNFFVTLEGIQVCTSLLYLEASHNMIRDESAVYKCESLKGLTLQRNRLSNIGSLLNISRCGPNEKSLNSIFGDVPETDSNIVTSLNDDDDDDDDINSHDNEPSIVYLNIDRNLLLDSQKMFSNVVYFKTLKSISMNHCGLKSLIVLKDLNQLEELYCMHNKIVDLPEVGDVLSTLTSLHTINLVGNPIEKDSTDEKYIVDLLLHCPTIRYFDTMKIPFHLIDQLIIQKASDEGITKDMEDSEVSRRKFHESVEIIATEVDEQLLKLRKLSAKVQERHDKESNFINKIIKERKEDLSKESLLIQNIHPTTTPII